MNNQSTDGLADQISQCLQLAILLEVSAYPKPGNVHRTADYQDTRYEHFLASAVAVAPHLRNVAKKGIRACRGSITLDRINVGKTIKDSMSDIASWQHDRNTLLGSIVLLAPIAAGAGLTMADKRSFSVNALRQGLKHVVESTTPKDAVDFYDAIAIAKPGGLGRAARLDVNDEMSRREILARGTSLHEIFMISSEWDIVSAEWTSNFHVTLDLGYPFFKVQMDKFGDINTASVHTFLRILSLVPDTLIARKAGRVEAERVSQEARKVLDSGGLTTPTGKDSLHKLDRKLHDVSHKLNPGSTADLTCAVLAVAILEGYRP